jgi:hypothetical protein
MSHRHCQRAEETARCREHYRPVAPACLPRSALIFISNVLFRNTFHALIDFDDANYTF